MLGDDENVYPNFISFSSAHSYQPQSSPYASSTTKRLSVTALDEWNRRCNEEGGVFLREHFTTNMLNLNSSQKKSWSPLAEQRDRLNSQTSSSLSNSYHGYNKDDWGDDISLTYSHDWMIRVTFLYICRMPWFWLRLYDKISNWQLLNH
jgi:hypothetical protein